MKDAVQRVIDVVHARRFAHDVMLKGQKADGGNDWVTDVDLDAQRIYVKLLREWFPEFGIIAEEEGLRVDCTHPTHNIYFTCDPIDGTRAFKDRQSHGIGTMLALVCDGEVIAVCIGDINTGEIYYYRPESEKTHRIQKSGIAVPLSIDQSLTLKSAVILLRDPIEDHCELTHALMALRPFKSHEITGGSIGISMARLWKGEVGAALLRPRGITPWDDTPVVGMTRRLGFLFMRVNNMGLHLFTPELLEMRADAEDEILIVHQSCFNELFSICKANDIRVLGLTGNEGLLTAGG